MQEGLYVIRPAICRRAVDFYLEKLSPQTRCFQGFAKEL
jgi:hypothetical protein